MANGDSQYTMEVRFVAVDEGLTKVLGEVEKATARTEQTTRRSGQAFQGMGTSAQGATRGVRLLSSGIISELDPNLANLVGRLTMATVGIRLMGLQLGTLSTIGIATAVAALTVLISRTKEQAEFQAKLGTAIDSTDFGGLKSQLAGLNQEIRADNELMKSWTGSIVVGAKAWANFLTGAEPVEEKMKKIREAIALVIPDLQKLQKATADLQMAQIRLAVARQGPTFEQGLGLTAQGIEGQRAQQSIAATLAVQTAQINQLRKQAQLEITQLGAIGAPQEARNLVLQRLQGDIDAVKTRTQADIRQITDSLQRAFDPIFTSLVERAQKAGFVVGTSLTDSLRAALKRDAGTMLGEERREFALSQLGLSNPELEDYWRQVIAKLRELRAAGIGGVELPQVTQTVPGGPLSLALSTLTPEGAFQVGQIDFQQTLNTYIKGSTTFIEQALRTAEVDAIKAFQQFGVNVADEGARALIQGMVREGETFQQRRGLADLWIKRLIPHERDIRTAGEQAVREVEDAFGSITKDMDRRVREMAEFESKRVRADRARLRTLPEGTLRSVEGEFQRLAELSRSMSLSLPFEQILQQARQNIRMRVPETMAEFGSEFEKARMRAQIGLDQQMRELGADLPETFRDSFIEAQRRIGLANLIKESFTLPIRAALAEAEQIAADPSQTLDQQAESGIRAGLMRTRLEIGEFGEDMARATQEIGATMGRGLGDAFFNFSTGQLNKFADVWQNLWQGLARTASDITSRLITRLLLDWLGFGQQMNAMRFGGGGGGFSWLLGLLGMGGGGGGVDVNSFIAGIESTGGFVPLQHGGIVTRPTLSLIGERGPEAVLPLSQLGAASAGGGVTVINLIRQEELAAIMAQEVGKGRQVVMVDVMDELRNNKMLRRGMRRSL